MLTFGTFVMVHSHAQGLKGLEIFSENYPRAGYFRVAEFTIRQNYKDQPDKYKEWRDRFSDLSGILGKTEHEELIRNNPHEQIWNWFNRYKKDFPNKFVIVHMNGRGRIPNYRLDKFSAGHWLYFEGADVQTDLPGRGGNFEKDVWIKVANPDKFQLDNGARRRSKDDITLVRKNKDGSFDWEHAEYVRLLEKDGDRIKIRRAMFGSKPLEFSKDNTYAAPKVMEGPWGETQNMVWYYNLSTHCPKDKNGKTCADILLEELAGNFKKGGRWQHFDGVQFDVMMGEPIMGAHASRRALGQWPDVNMDGVEDKGIVDGLQSYGIGVFDFVSRLRKAVGPDKIIAADGRNVASQQVGNKAFNGAEMEGFPSQEPRGFVHWSTPINLLDFWRGVTGEPYFNYAAFRYDGPHHIDKKDLLAHYRLAFAGTAFTDSFILANSWTTRDGIPDIHEVFGLSKTEKPTGWLGKPIGEGVHLAGTEPYSGSDLLGGRGKPVQASILDTGSNAPYLSVAKNTIARLNSGGALELEPVGSADGLRFGIKNIPFEQEQVYIELTMRSGKIDQRYPEGYLRSASFILNGIRRPKETVNMVKMNGDWFTYRIYFGNAFDTKTKEPIVYNRKGEKVVDLEIVVHDALGTVEISEVAVNNAPEIVYRDFEHGTVVANLSAQDFVWKDRNLTIPAKDALFVRKK